MYGVFHPFGEASASARVKVKRTKPAVESREPNQSNIQIEGLGFGIEIGRGGGIATVSLGFGLKVSSSFGKATHPNATQSRESPART